MNQAILELDARSLPPPRRHPEIFRTFDQLAPGEAFVLVDEEEPKPLLCQFQSERPRAFEWSVLEAGPSRFRIEIRRRSPHVARGVREFLGADHRRLDTILRSVARLAHGGSFGVALERFGDFRCGLDRHIEMEERILFPLFEERTGMSGGPTTVMRVEHQQIRRLMDAIAESLRSEDFAALLEATRDFTALLEAHNAKEENVLYPMVDRTLGGDRERDEIVRRMQRL